MSAQLDLSCTSPRYHVWRTYAYIMVALYPCGVPVFLYLVLFTHRHEIERMMTAVAIRESRGASPDTNAGQVHDELDGETTGAAAAQANAEPQVSRVVKALGSKFYDYRPTKWWFGVFELVVRLLQTSLLVFLLEKLS